MPALRPVNIGMSVNLGAIHVELTPADLQEMEAELSRIKMHGGRMSAKYRVEVEE